MDFSTFERCPSFVPPDDTGQVVVQRHRKCRPDRACRWLRNMRIPSVVPIRQPGGLNSIVMLIFEGHRANFCFRSIDFYPDNRCVQETIISFSRTPIFATFAAKVILLYFPEPLKLSCGCLPRCILGYDYTIYTNRIEPLIVRVRCDKMG